MKKSYVPILMIFCFLNIAWLGGWMSNRLVNNLIITGKISTTQTAKPTIGTCGTSPTVATGSTDISGYFTVGGVTAVTSCTITFDSAWATAPNCILMTKNAAVTMGATTDTTHIYATSAATMSTDTVAYFCVSN